MTSLCYLLACYKVELQKRGGLYLSNSVKVVPTSHFLPHNTNYTLTIEILITKRNRLNEPDNTKHTINQQNLNIFSVVFATILLIVCSDSFRSNIKEDRTSLTNLG